MSPNTGTVCPLSDTSSMPDHEEVSGRAVGILIRLGDRLSLQTQEIVHELVEHNESGVALEVMADMLAESGASITDPERNEMLRLVSDMGMDDGVGSQLARQQDGVVDQPLLRAGLVEHCPDEIPSGTNA